MGLIRDRHGTYYARQKVPERLQAAVARVLDQGKDRQSFLKKSLGTKDLKAANVRAKSVVAGFDRVFGKAEQLLSVRPMRESLSAIGLASIASQGRAPDGIKGAAISRQFWLATLMPQPSRQPKKAFLLWDRGRCCNGIGAGQTSRIRR
jgi:hypothetical protein